MMRPLDPYRWLAPYAATSQMAGPRLHGAEEDPHRSPFQRDRDRVIHSTAFRRLQYKTQVFVYHEGDHYRSRMTHTLEVAQVARSLARDLYLDEDLTEVAALAHDLGHPPFGHAGERALNAVMAHYDGFDHNAQSLRVVMSLEQRYGRFDGLNLTQLSLASLAKHNGPLSEEERAHPFWQDFAATTGIDLTTHGVLEAQIAAISDDIAYNAHDVEDGLRSRLISLEQLETIPLTKAVIKDITLDYPNCDVKRLRSEITRRLITLFIRDISFEVRKTLEDIKPQSANDLIDYNAQIAVFSPDMAVMVAELKDFLFKNLYRHKEVERIMDDAVRVLQDLFRLHFHTTDLLPKEWQDRIEGLPESARARKVCDYIAGMTDRFALQKHSELFDDTPLLR